MHLAKVALVVVVSVAVATSSFYDHVVLDANGNEFSLDKLKGTVTLVVNVASYCGFTYQYQELVELKKEMGDRLNILAFPCNQFGEQEPEHVSTIIKSMTEKYQVNFDILGKVEVTGDSVPHAWKYLIDESKTEPRWNFYKYLITPEGLVSGAWGPKIEPRIIRPFIKQLIKHQASPKANDEL